MKDFDDVQVLLSRFSLDNEILRTAIRNTIARRQTALSARGTALFTPEFMKEERLYREQFLRRNGMELGALMRAKCDWSGSSIGCFAWLESGGGKPRLRLPAQPNP